MAGFLIRRLLQALFVIVAVTLLVSYAIRLTGDPALMLSQGSGSVNEADLENIRQALGLNRPFWVQYVTYLQGMLHGDFGRSFLGGTSVARLISDALPATLVLAFTSVVASIAISIPFGIRAAVRRGKPIDQVIRIVSLVGLSFPNFWLALMLVLLLSITCPAAAALGLGGPHQHHHAVAHDGDHPERDQHPTRAHHDAGDAVGAVHHGSRAARVCPSAWCSTSTRCAIAQSHS